LAEWRSESLWGIRTAQDIKDSIETFRARPIRALGGLQGTEANSPGGPDAAAVARARARDRVRFERQERSVLLQQQKLLRARAALKTIKLTHLAIQEGRRALQAERNARIAAAREGQRRWRAAVPTARPRTGRDGG